MNAADMQKVMDYLKRDSIVKVSSGEPGDTYSLLIGSQSNEPLVHSGDGCRLFSMQRARRSDLGSTGSRQK